MPQTPGKWPSLGQAQEAGRVCAKPAKHISLLTDDHNLRLLSEKDLPDTCLSPLFNIYSFFIKDLFIFYLYENMAAVFRHTRRGYRIP